MTERSLFWTDGTGHGGPYSQDELRLLSRALLGGDDGVLRGQHSEYAVSINGSALRVAAGRALVNGTLAESDTNIDLTPTVPSSGTTGLRVVLRKSWSARTVAVALLEAADGTITPPAVTQANGTTWEVSLATAEITTGGSIQNLVPQTTSITAAPSFLENAKNQSATYPQWMRFAGVHGNYSTGAALGQGLFTVVGTGASFSAADERGQAISHGATNGTSCGLYSSSGVFKTSETVIVLARATPSSVAGQTWVLGLAATSPTFMGITNQHQIQFHISGTGSLVARTTRSGTSTDTTTAVTPDGQTEYQLRIEVDPGGAQTRFFVDGSLEAVHTSNIPTTATALFAQAGSRSGGTTATSYIKHFDILQGS